MILRKKYFIQQHSFIGKYTEPVGQENGIGSDGIEWEYDRMG
jgi:hypothetical protein